MLLNLWEGVYDGKVFVTRVYRVVYGLVVKGVSLEKCGGVVVHRDYQLG